MVSTDTSATGYCHFVNGFAQTDYDDVKLNGTPQAINGGFNVPIIIHATEETPSGTWQTTYQGYQTVMQVNKGWMINGGKLQKMDRSALTDPTPNPDPTQEGQTIMQQFYDAINKRDYPAAYKLWGAAFDAPPIIVPSSLATRKHCTTNIPLAPLSSKVTAACSSP